MERCHLTETALWHDRLYIQTAGLVLGFLIILSLVLFVFRNRSTNMTAAWASIKSWFFAAPLILLFMALPNPWPLVFLTLVAVFSTKVFYQMTGMYHRSWFVIMSYAFHFALGLIVYYPALGPIYNLMPMIFMGCVACIPLVRNSANHMIQYMALSLMAYILLGWAYMHLARLLVLDRGVFIVLYLYILCEISDAVSLSSSRVFGKLRPFHNITVRVTIEGVLVSIVASLLLAWALRHMLPDSSEKFWIAAGIISAIFGRFGDLFLSTIRRDLGVKNSGIFILGRGDILGRIDKLTFVAPMFYYAYLFLHQVR